MTLDYDSLLPALASTARRAGEAILEHYRGEFAVERKTDGSPVTAADHASELIIVEALRRLTPEIPVVSEEAAEAGHVPDISGRSFWLVDPLDGTKEFVRRNGEFAVNIGLILDFLPAAGVIYAPAQDRLYAGAGGRAWREEGGRREPITARTPDRDGIVVAISRSHPSPRLEAYLASLPVKGRLIHGSAIKLALVAAGEADLYPRFGPTMEWDTAAGHAILEAAGGRLEDLDGNRLAYGKPGFRNDGFMARGRAG